MDDLEETLDGELDRVVLAHLGGPVLLEELAHGLGRATDRVRLVVRRGVGCKRSGSRRKERERETHLPGTKDAAGLGHEEARGGVVVVKADDEARDPERSHSSRLRVFLFVTVLWNQPSCSSGGKGDRRREGGGGGEMGTHLLDLSNVSGDVLDRDGVLDGQPVTLALDPRAVDQDARVGGQA